MSSRKHTHEKHESFSPDMAFVCFSTEDILTEPDRTLRTVAPAGTAPASSTGMCLLCNVWISAYLSLVLHASSESGELVSAQSYVHRAVILNHISRESSVLWLARIAILLCVTAPPDTAL